MEFRQLRYFTRIAELGSISKASRALFIAQPALSTQIAQLEGELGQKLLHRLSTGVVLTEAGQAFYTHAIHILKQMDDAKAVVGAAVDHPSGRVAVGLPQSTASAFAFPLMAEVNRKFPGIVLEFFEELSGNILYGLNSGKLDIGVIVNDEDAKMLKSTPLMDEALYLISRPDRQPSTQQTHCITMEELVDLPLALPGLLHGVRHLIEETLHARRLRLGALKVEANSMSIMKRCIRDGMTHSIMPWGAVAVEIESGEMVATVIEPTLSRSVCVCTSVDLPLSRAATVVLDELVNATRGQVMSGAWKGVQLRTP